MCDQKEKMIRKITVSLQKECHKTVGILIKTSPKVTYQDATNVWIFRKLAEMQLKISEMEDRNLGLVPSN